MTSEKIDALCKEITENNFPDKIKKENAEGADGASKEKLSYKYSTLFLTILVFVLLIFFLGLRYTERREAPEYSITDTTAISSDKPADDGVSDKVNINTADINELTVLDGIGQKRAQSIIDYRNEYGRFTSVDEILDVPGIGESIFELIKNSITVE